jgi:N-acetylmuramoyl-L-alanine amidase
MLTALSWSQRICIDPGHPSEVGRGTSGKKITEVHAAWKVAVYLKEELEANDFEVVMTKKSENQLVKNKDRSGIANKFKANLMIRLHCDAQGGSGFTVYVPTQKGKSQGRTGPSDDVIFESKQRGKLFHAGLKVALGGKLKDNGFLSDKKTFIGSKQGALTGSIFSEVPVVLLEMCRLTNPKDDAFMASDANQRFYAKAIAEACVAALRPAG